MEVVSLFFHSPEADVSVDNPEPDYLLPLDNNDSPSMYPTVSVRFLTHL